jgi:hypothetical protein
MDMSFPARRAVVRNPVIAPKKIQNHPLDEPPVV